MVILGLFVPVCLVHSNMQANVSLINHNTTSICFFVLYYILLNNVGILLHPLINDWQCVKTGSDWSTFDKGVSDCPVIGGHLPV